MKHSEWLRARQLTVNERRLLRRHSGALLLVAMLHGFLTLEFWYLGLMPVGGGYLAVLLLALLLWSGGYAGLMASGRTLHRREPSCSLPVALGLTTLFLVTAWPLAHGRISALMLFYPMLLLVSFRLGVRALMILVCWASAGYAAIIALALTGHGPGERPTLEVLQWLVFTLVGVSFVVSGAGVNGLRRSLADKNRALGAALEQVRDLAIRDDLTGLFNRRHIMEVLGHQKALADNQAYSFAVCYVDLDYFKRINDEFSHAWGDRVLQCFAEHTLENLREGDYMARLGGEEFILLLPQSDLEGAVRMAERLRQSWSRHHFDDQGGPRSVSLSAGVAVYRQGETVDQLLARADHALYLAKSGGRNRVCEDS